MRLFYLLIIIGLAGCASSRAVKRNWAYPAFSHAAKNLDTTIMAGKEVIDSVIVNGKTLARAFTEYSFEQPGGYKQVYKLSREALRLRISKIVITNGYWEHKYFPGDIYRLSTYYSANGVVKQRGLVCLNSFYAGKWYTYKADGTIDHITDYDDGFLFTTADVLKYCRKNRIPLNADSVHINRVKTKEGNTWMIRHKTQRLGRAPYDHFILNGNTGALIKKQEVDVIEFRCM